MNVYSAIEINQLRSMAEDMQSAAKKILKMIGSNRPGMAIAVCETAAKSDDEIINLIADLVVRKNSVKKSEIFSGRRPADVAATRHLCFWLIRKATPLSLNRIGQKMGGLNHGTVMHGILNIENRRSIEPQFKEFTDNLLREAATLIGDRKF